MPFVAAKCPGCGAAIQLPDEKKQANCAYCGLSVLVEQAIQLAVASGPSLATFLELGNASLINKRSDEAFGYFSRALELDTSLPDAWIGKAKSSIGLASLNDTRMDEIKNCCLQYVKLSGDKGQAAALAVATLSDYALVVSEAIQDHFTQHGGTLTGQMGSMKPIVRDDQLAEWVHGITSAALLHRDAVELASEYCEDAAPDALRAELKTLRKFAERSFMTEVQCRADFTDGTTYDRSMSIVVPISSERRSALFGLYQSSREHLLRLDPASAESVPELDSLISAQNKKMESAGSMCFVATACYGSADHQSVVILRQYRDDVLLNSRIGVAFVQLYYRIGPILAECIATRPTLRDWTRIIICAPSAKLASMILNQRQKRTTLK